MTERWYRILLSKGKKCMIMIKFIDYLQNGRNKSPCSFYLKRQSTPRLKPNNYN